MTDSQRVQYPTRAVLNKPLVWGLVTTSATADQEIGTHTPPADKKFCVQVIIVTAFFTTLSTTAAYLGTIKLKWNGVAITPAFEASNTSSGAIFGVVVPIPGEYVFNGDGEKALQMVCTPAVATSIKWRASIIGYERD